MNAALRLSNRHTLHTVYATFKLKLAKSAVAANLKDNFLHTTCFVFILRNQFGFQMMTLSIFEVHTIKLARK